LGDYFRSAFPDFWLVRKLSVSGADWGTFGDFVGGFLNPMIAGLTLWIIVRDGAMARSQALQSAKEKNHSFELQKSNLKIQSDIFSLQKDIAADQKEIARTNFLTAVSRRYYLEYESVLRREEVLWGLLARCPDADELKRIEKMIDENDGKKRIAFECIEKFERMHLDVSSKAEN